MIIYLGDNVGWIAWVVVHLRYKQSDAQNTTSIIIVIIIIMVSNINLADHS